MHRSAYRGQDGRHYCRGCGRALTLSSRRRAALEHLYEVSRAFAAVSNGRPPVLYALALRDLERAVKDVEEEGDRGPDDGPPSPESRGGG
jgi:hypothetical protein